MSPAEWKLLRADDKHAVWYRVCLSDRAREEHANPWVQVRAVDTGSPGGAPQLKEFELRADEILLLADRVRVERRGSWPTLRRSGGTQYRHDPEG